MQKLFSFNTIKVLAVVLLLIVFFEEFRGHSTPGSHEPVIKKAGVCIEAAPAH